MATTTETVQFTTEANDAQTKSHHREPLKYSGSLDQFKSFDVTPIIGREFPEVSIKELLDAPNADELLRDLAITSTHITYMQALILY